MNETNDGVLSYPETLRTAERAAINERRRNAGVSLDAPVVGVALSGGGIRSATFCLGLFQALARLKLLSRIDLLSTVSGGGYFGGFLGAALSRPGSSVAQTEQELANNHSWSVNWLRENGRFLSPNGAGDSWIAVAVALRNWSTLHVVLLTFSFLLLALGALIRADLCTGRYTGEYWRGLEQYCWDHPAMHIWWSPWLVLPLIPLVLVMVPTATVYWLTQFLPLMKALRACLGIFRRQVAAMTMREFAAHAQNVLTRSFMMGLVVTLALLGFAAADSLGQTGYLRWSANSFSFPSLWALLTGTGIGLFAFGSKITIYIERLLGKRMFAVPLNVVALALALLWALLIVLAESVVACGFAWQWQQVVVDGRFQPMSGGWPLMLAIAVCFAASWFFSRAFSFVNLSSMQQIYAARLSRAYLGATNPQRRRHANHSMTDLIPGDDLPLDAYAPHRQGGPLHLINVTVNETVSGKTQIERCDRKGLAMAVGPCGLSVGIDSHALWGAESLDPAACAARLETPQRPIAPIVSADGECQHALCRTPRGAESGPPCHRIEALPLGRWVAISGAAFTTGTGSNTSLGLSLLLGLANIRLGYWWDSGIAAGQSGAPRARPNFLELLSRLVSRILPVQTCLMTEFFARFHGPGRRHWYLSDGGHFENTACYELIRRRVPFIICSDAGQDRRYEFGDFANLVRKARIDFGAEIQVVRRRADLATDDPGVRFPMPKLEELVHPNLIDVIGTPEDFPALATSAGNEDKDADEKAARPLVGRARAHAMLARIHYTDTDEFSWLLLVKPSLQGDETADVIQYQRTHGLFPQEPTTDQYFDEAQWESYRKLGEHIGTELFTAPAPSPDAIGAAWSPSLMCAPEMPHESRARVELAAFAARLT